MSKVTRKAPDRAPDVIDVPPENPILALVRSEGGQITNWLAGLLRFKATADDLERQAKQGLERARTFKAPASPEQDEAIVTEIRIINSRNKTTEAHWAITAIIFNFQRRLAAERNRATTMNEEATRLLNGHHNGWVESEKRRVAREADEKRQREEQEAREQQERDAAEQDNKALELEGNMPELSDREQKFVDDFFRTIMDERAAVGAAKRVGYRDPVAAARKLLETPKIKTALEAMKRAADLRRQATATRAKPVEVEVQQEKPQYSTAGRTTWGYEVLDEAAFMAAVLDPLTRTRLGIPSEIATFKPSVLSECAKSLHENLDRWPGVRHTKKTGVV
jgi:hypothetical protein